ncbi:MAG: 4Fe-4S binding protein [Oligoflexia bacterium]|nr:4Fe-4S binding protein [Oligoflexia bacterium]
MRLSRIIANRLKALSQEPSATVEFPYAIRHAPQGARVSLRNNFSECIGCLKCEAVCPVQCIDITSENFPTQEKVPRTSKGVLFEKRVTSYVIDFNQCVNCGLCVGICPTGSLTNERTFITPRQDERHLKIDLVHRPRALRKDQGYED